MKKELKKGVLEVESPKTDAPAPNRPKTRPHLKKQISEVPPVKGERPKPEERCDCKEEPEEVPPARSMAKIPILFMTCNTESKHDTALHAIKDDRDRVRREMVRWVKELQGELDRGFEGFCLAHGCLVYPRQVEGAIRILRHIYDITEEDLE